MLSVALRNVMADAGAATITELSLHTGDPGTAGDNEVTGGTYSRQTVTWSAATGGTATVDGEVVFDVPGGTSVTHVGAWNTDGDLVAADDIPEETFGADGELALVQVTLPVADAS